MFLEGFSEDCSQDAPKTHPRCPPAARPQMHRDVDRFAARRPSADASRCGSLCRPPPARRCIEIRQDVPHGFPIKRASAVLNLEPSCSRELSVVTRFPFFC